MAHYRRFMDLRVEGLGTASVVRNPAMGTYQGEGTGFGVAPREGDVSFGRDRRLPVVTIRIRSTRLEGDPVVINDATTAIVEQGFNRAYQMAQEYIGRAGGFHFGDRVTVWLEVAAFDRDAPAIVLARDVAVNDLIGAVEDHLDDIAEYEAERLQGQLAEVGAERNALMRTLNRHGFDARRFERTHADHRAAYLTEFMEDQGEALADEDPNILHRLGWFQLNRYLMVAHMEIYYMFYLVPAPARAPRGWKDGVEGLTRNQLFRIGAIIPKEVTEGNGLCLYLAVEYATTFTYDLGKRKIEKEIIDAPVALRSWEEPVERLGRLRDEWGLTQESELLVQLNALSLFHQAVIHVFDYESGGEEVAYSSEDVKFGKREAHKVIMIMGGHAYPITRPHFLVQSTAKYLFCPVCFHCFGKKSDLFYHMERCSRDEPMDTIDYNVRRRFERRRFLGLHFAIKGVGFKTCSLCGKLGIANGAEADLGHVPGVYCQCETFVPIGSRQWIRALRCMRCQVAFPPSLEKTHQCRMRVKEDKAVELENCWVYDIESCLDTVLDEALAEEEDVEDWSLSAEFETLKSYRQRHTPNLIVMMSLLEDECLTFPTIGAFLDAIYSDKRFEGARFYAHNAGRYDTHFIVGELLRRGCVPDFLPGSSSGYTNMLMVGFEKRSFMDSYRLFPQGLAALAKSFGLPVEKGRFPYRFNRKENQDYVGPLPDLRWFDPWDVRGGTDSMDDLIKWHGEETERYSGGTWNLQEQLMEYCYDDVRILRAVMLRGIGLFQTIFQASERQFPHWEAPVINIIGHLTLTSAVVGACLYGMRNKCRLALRDVDSMFVDAERFYDMVLAYEHYFREKTIRTVPALEDLDVPLKGYEVELGVVRVYVDCFQVGCLKCYPTQKLIVPPNKESFGTLRERFEEVRGDLWERVGVRGVEYLNYYWTHDYQQMFKEVPSDEQALLHTVIDPYWPIDAREAMFGGHTEAGALFAKSFGRHKICKIDVNSMYPFVCAELELPFGDPVTIRMDEVDRSMLERREYFGLVRARFRPPKDLLFPILPRKIGNPGKLVFDCEERIGTYTTVDVYHAMDLGYEVLEVFEIRHFPPSQRKVGLFAEYVTVLFDVKAQAKRDEDPALYLLCKFALNSLWGKFGEKVHTSYFGFVSSVRGYMDFMNAETIRDGSREFLEVADDVYLVKANYEKIVCDAPRFYHPELACFVLAHARKILHSAIFDLGPGRFLYCDTDSIIYLHTMGQSTPPIGTALGEWDIEVAGWPERYIERFYSCGPKAYCEVYSDGTHKVCYKGVMGSCRNKTILDPAKFHELVTEYLHHQGMDAGSGMTLSTQDFSIRVNYSQELGVNVRSDYTVKRVRVVNEKRFVPDLLESYEDIEEFVLIRTLPYGFEGNWREMAYVSADVFSRDFSY